MKTAGNSASIIVGVTGKRDLQGKEVAVANAFDAIFKTLEDQFPASPKILLTALAEGADRIAVDRLAGYPNWKVVAILPLEASLYRQDFTGDPASAFDGYLAREDLRVLTLPTLNDNGKPLSSSQLQRTAVSNKLRTLHYEQAGLYIANAATIMVGVMPGTEQPGRVGGTARIVNYRLKGSLDGDAQDVVRRSSVLPKPDALQMVRPGFVWLIDTDHLGESGPLAGRLPFEVRHGFEKAEEIPQDPAAASRVLAHAIDRFNRRAQARPVASGHALNGPPDAANILTRLRASVSSIQRHASGKVRRTALLLGGAFAAAVIFWDVYVERHQFPDSVLFGFAAIAAYALSILLAIAAHHLTRRRRWQPIAEDYRAVAEALRVQLAWWECGLAGLEYRADTYYLPRARGSLNLVREAIRTLIDTAWFTAGSPARVANAANVWIESQKKYFKMRIKQLHTQLVRIEYWSWFLFLSSLGAAALFLLLQLLDYERVSMTIGRHVGPQQSWALAAAAAAGTGLLLFLLEWRPKTVMRLSSERKPILRPIAWVVSPLVGMAAGTSLVSAFDGSPVGETIASILLIAAVAAAGALRFIAEKLSWEADYRNYINAIHAFETAERRLGEIAASGLPAAEQDRDRAVILLELGKLALAENESWLRAHRDRPLEIAV